MRHPSPEEVPVPRVTAPRGELAPYEQANIELFERISPSVGGQPIRSTDDLWLALDRKRAGEEVEVEFVRDGRRVEATVILGQPERR